VKVVMTLTSPNCPVAESLPEEVYEKVLGVDGVSEVELNLTFDPPWTKDMLSEEALLELGLL
jgi:metal-sulfur cluster biosynthetic enzyme